MKRTTDGLQITARNQGAKQKPFIARNSLSLADPVKVSMILRTTSPGEIGLSWRTSADKDFVAGNRVNVAVSKSGEWQSFETNLSAGRQIIHVRVQVPSGITTIKSLDLKPADGKTATLSQ